MDYAEYAMYYGPEAADRAVAEQQAQSNHAGETAGERVRRLIAEHGFSEWIPMVGRTDEVDWELWARQAQHRRDAADSMRYASAMGQDARDWRKWFTDPEPSTPKTITLAKGEYWWGGAAPELRLHPDTYADIVNALRQFKGRATRPTGLAMNLITAQAFADLFTPGAKVDGSEARMHMFGIPITVEPDIPTGVLRLRNGYASSDVTLREAPGPKPPTGWDPTPRWQREHETQWWGTYGNPLLRPTGL